MRRDDGRDKLPQHLKHSGVDGDKAHEIYADDAVLEFPRSGERQDDLPARVPGGS